MVVKTTLAIGTTMLTIDASAQSVAAFSIEELDEEAGSAVFEFRNFTGSIKLLNSTENSIARFQVPLPRKTTSAQHALLPSSKLQ